MTLLTRARARRTLLLILALLLASCAPNDETPATAVILPRVNGVLSERVPAARKAAIRAQLAAICPRPLWDDELEWAAEFVEATQSKGATWIAGRLLRMHRETNICRGQ